MPRQQPSSPLVPTAAEDETWADRQETQERTAAELADNHAEPEPLLELAPLDPRIEPTPPVDRWRWTAHYDDGTTLSESGPDGDHGFAEVDLRRIRAFELDPVDPVLGVNAFCVLIDPAKNQRPIFFRRRVASPDVQGGSARHAMTCIGRQETISLGCDSCGARSFESCRPRCAAKRAGTAARHRNVSTYVFFDDDGHVLIADNPKPLG